MNPFRNAILREQIIQKGKSDNHFLIQKGRVDNDLFYVNLFQRCIF